MIPDVTRTLIISSITPSERASQSFIIILLIFPFSRSQLFHLSATSFTSSRLSFIISGCFISIISVKLFTLFLVALTDLFFLDLPIFLLLFLIPLTASSSSSTIYFRRLLLLCSLFSSSLYLLTHSITYGSLPPAFDSEEFIDSE